MRANTAVESNLNFALLEVNYLEQYFALLVAALRPQKSIRRLRAHARFWQPFTGLKRNLW